jgi:hypothetical protein
MTIIETGKTYKIEIGEIKKISKIRPDKVSEIKYFTGIPVLQNLHFPLRIK